MDYICGEQSKSRNIAHNATNFMTIIVLITITVIVLLLTYWRWHIKKIEDWAQSLMEPIRLYFEDISTLQNHYISKTEGNIFISKWKELYSNALTHNVSQKNKTHKEINRFKNSYKNLPDYINSLNQNYIDSESAKFDAFFSNIDGKSLDKQQRTAVITDENRVLVLAGAGSGKTLTIAAKVKYLCEAKGVDPQDILLISFTKKSAQEMTERIHDKLGIPIEAMTFHKLGLDIIKQNDGCRPEIADENILFQFVHDFFENKLLQHPDLIQNLIEYFAYFIDIPQDMEKYKSLGECYEDEKKSDLETLKSKYEREQYIREAGEEKAKQYTTLNNEIVKSLEETKIANFLFLHGVNYEYEKLYPYESDDPMRKSYRPDFYLSDYDIYLEHFGVTKEFKVPWLSKVEEKKYLDGIKWKRDFHKENNTKLIETYSYYNSEGILLKKLYEILQENNVSLKQPDFTDIFNTVYASKSNKYFSEFIKLCCTFITLFKSNNYKIEQIKDIKRAYLKKESNLFLQKRTSIFLDIIQTILSEYQNHLSENHTIDFSDMINDAAGKIAAGLYIHPYKHVIVDEYQDISKSRFNLLKAIANKTGAKFFCVGDDWQSIYRFAGSDISLFTDFEKNFGSTKVLRIEKTYRNSQQLINEASRFILQNPLQLKKDLYSDKNISYPLVFWGYNDTPKKALQSIINKIISDYGTKASILLLGRTNYDIEIAKETGLFRCIYEDKREKLSYIPAPELKLDFLSVHKSKGLEADNVILLNFKNDKLGFPSQIADDRVLDLVLTNTEDYKFAEERRLFYVAITRTKNRTYILTDNKNPSTFLKEFTESPSVCFVSLKTTQNNNQTKCPHCKTGNLLEVEHNGISFIGCSNFPKCKYTLRNVSILHNPVKCPLCGGFLVKRKNKNGHWFIGCTNYPYCAYTEPI